MMMSTGALSVLNVHLQFFSINSENREGMTWEQGEIETLLVFPSMKQRRLEEDHFPEIFRIPWVILISI